MTVVFATCGHQPAPTADDQVLADALERLTEKTRRLGLLSLEEELASLGDDTLRRALAGGTPRVELEVIITQDRGTTTWHATARTRVLRDGEELLVAKRLREVFEAARVRA